MASEKKMPGEEIAFLNLGRAGSISTQIKNARVTKDAMSLDKNGFQLMKDQVSCLSTQDFYDAEKVKSCYYPELNAAIAKELHAEKAVAFIHRVRNASKANNEGDENNAILNYVPKVHIDYSMAQGKELVQSILQLEELDPTKRYQVLNVWRNISEEIPIQADPLAVADTATISSSDIFTAHLMLKKPNVAVSAAASASASALGAQWYYYPQMTFDEFLVFRQYDSTRNLDDMCFHSSFETTYQKQQQQQKKTSVPTRESIETRLVIVSTL